MPAFLRTGDILARIVSDEDSVNGTYIQQTQGEFEWRGMRFAKADVRAEDICVDRSEQLMARKLCAPGARRSSPWSIGHDRCAKVALAQRSQDGECGGIGNRRGEYRLQDCGRQSVLICGLGYGASEQDGETLGERPTA